VIFLAVVVALFKSTYWENLGKQTFAVGKACRCKMEAPFSLGNVQFSPNFGPQISVRICFKNGVVLFAMSDMQNVLQRIDPDSILFSSRFSRFSNNNTEFIFGLFYFKSLSAIYKHLASHT